MSKLTFNHAFQKYRNSVKQKGKKQIKTAIIYRHKTESSAVGQFFSPVLALSLSKTIFGKILWIMFFCFFSQCCYCTFNVMCKLMTKWSETVATWSFFDGEKKAFIEVLSNKYQTTWRKSLEDNLHTVKKITRYFNKKSVFGLSELAPQTCNFWKILKFHEVNFNVQNKFSISYVELSVFI